MTNDEKLLIRFVAYNQHRDARMTAKRICESNTVQKDKQFCDSMLAEFNKPVAELLPASVQGLLYAEDTTKFDTSRMLIREHENQLVQNPLDTYQASERLREKGVRYFPALLLYGESGCGKTTLAKYISHKLGLPFVYVRFSNVVSSYLGSTSGNISKIFDYARTNPCVLCLDELDAIGMSRGNKQDVTEMNRVVISLMQEMDRFPEHSVLIGTTNRVDKIDSALFRRFTMRHVVSPLKREEVELLAGAFFADMGIETSEWLTSWVSDVFENAEAEGIPVSSVVEKCTEKTISIWREREASHD